MLPSEAIKQFKDIYRDVFNEELSDAEASRRANNLLEFYKAVYLPVDDVPDKANTNYA